MAHRTRVSDWVGKALREREQANVAANENRGLREARGVTAIEELQKNENCLAWRLGGTIFAVRDEAKSQDLR
jgi:hypothetical protein